MEVQTPWQKEGVWREQPRTQAPIQGALPPGCSAHLAVPAPLPPAGSGGGGRVLTVAHALQEVLEGFRQLPGLRGYRHILDRLALGEGGGPPPQPRQERGLSLTCVTCGSPPESAICRERGE